MRHDLFLYVQVDSRGGHRESRGEFRGPQTFEKV